jgi:UDP-3-O-[3-hydroxymyristoyl] glucosamine N-acyltransferase
MMLSKIALKIKGDLIGQDLDAADISTPENQTPNSVCILSSAKQTVALDGAAACYVVPKDFPLTEGKSFIVTDGDIRLALAGLLELLRPCDPPTRTVSSRASVALDAELGENVSVGDFAVLESGCKIGSETVIYAGVHVGHRVRIGKGCIIYPNVTIYEDTVIGDGVILHSGVVLGSDGFGFAAGKTHVKIPQRGNVVIADDVEIGANSTVDRATIESTVVGRGTKIDNMVHIAHNVRIGSCCLIAAQCGISGSTEIGDYVLLGGQVGIGDHVKIGSFTSFAAKTGVHKDMPEKGAYGGAPAMPAKVWMRQAAVVPSLPDIKRRVARIEKQLGIDHAGKTSSDNKGD